MPAEHVDVLIVGAGLSGIGAAATCRTSCPARRGRSSRPATRSAAPGTCSATRACGPTRTCSPSATAFRPWTETRAIADGADDPRLRPRHRRASAASTAHIRLRAPGGRGGVVERRPRAGRCTAERTATRATVELTCGVPATCCTGYYRYDEGYTPAASRGSSGSPGRSCTRSTGRPTSTTRASGWSSSAAARPRSPWSRRWPSDGRARDDAAALAELHRCRCRAATRSPTGCGRLLPARGPYAVVRVARTSLLARCVYQLSRRRPASMKALLRDGVRAPAARRATTSTPTSRPRYDPWDQRLCVVPDGDLFAADARRAGVGGHRPDRRRFTEPGIRLASGRRARRRHRRHRDRAEPARRSAGWR